MVEGLIWPAQPLTPVKRSAHSFGEHPVAATVTADAIAVRWSRCSFVSGSNNVLSTASTWPGAVAFNTPKPSSVNVAPQIERGLSRAHDARAWGSRDDPTGPGRQVDQMSLP